MSNPRIADNKPAKVELEEGTEYYFCTCGNSQGQPFCVLGKYRPDNG